MSNPLNFGTIVGRLASDPKSWANQDGSKKVAATVFVDRNYKNREGKVESDAIDVEDFVRAETQGLGPWDRVHKGDLVAIKYALRKDVYTKSGQTVYETKVIVENVSFLESKSVTDARLKARTEAAQGQNEQLGAQPAPVAAAPQGALGDESPFA